MSVSHITQNSAALTEAFANLLPQLSTSASVPTASEIDDFLAQPGVYLFCYRDGDDANAPILGMLTLATFTIPTGKRAWVEDVVVDTAARGHGAGAALVEAACTFAKEIGAKTVDLTSRPSREAANRLYKRCGFALRETNVYRFAN